jgi:hypothetical protein
MLTVIDESSRECLSIVVGRRINSSDVLYTLADLFIRRGIPYENAKARSVRYLRLLGVTAIEQIPRAVAGTEDMGEVLPDWCDRHQFRSIVVVSKPDHSRRVYRVLHRAMRDHQTRVRIRVTRYSGFDPDRWWETRSGIRTEIIELQKLLFDLIRHPLS